MVCYYGCLLTRPPQVTDAPHPENPTDMDQLMTALGAEVRDWSYKTSCCGAAHSLTRPDIVLKLSSGLIEHAREAGAEAIVVACPLCHMNLDARQFQMKLTEPVPVLYFTQLMALALGVPDKAALNKNLVDPRPMLASEGTHRFRRKRGGLPSCIPINPSARLPRALGQGSTINRSSARWPIRRSICSRRCSTPG